MKWFIAVERGRKKERNEGGEKEADVTGLFAIWGHGKGGKESADRCGLLPLGFMG